MPGGNDIDSLKFSVILDSQKFETEMKRVEGLAEKFEKAVRESLTITNLLEAAQSKGTKDTKAKAQAQKEVVLLTRAELEAKKAAGTITDKELKQLKALVAADKQLLDEQNKVLAAEKKQLDIQEKQERLARRQAAAERSKGDAAKFTTQELLLQSGTLRGLGSYITQYVSVFGAMSIVRNMVRITGEFEAQHTALRAILQDTAAADNIFNQLQVLAVKSPFTFQNLTAYAKQLTAFSVPVNEVYETTKKLADVSAGLGVDMGRIILAYGQVRSAEFLRGQEVRQFTEAGIPILKELADQFKEIEGHAISVGEVFTRISARQVPFEMVEEAFNRMTSAGGKFYQMQEVLAETVKGKISNLQDAWEIMLSRIGDQNSGTIKGIITWVTDLLANYERWMGVMSALIKMLGTYAAGLALVNTVMKVQNFLTNAKIALDVLQTNNTKVLNALFMSKHALNQLEIADDEKKIAVQTTLNIVRKAGIAVVTSLIAVIWTLIQRSKQAKEEANKDIDTINSAMAKLSASMADFNIGASRVESAFKKMKSAEGDATQETKDFEQAVDDLKKQFPKFIDDNLKLAETIDDLGTYWARAREEMNKYYADEARESIKTDLQSNRDSDVQNISKKFTKYVTGLYGKSGQAAGRMMATTAWRYVTGDIDRAEAYALAQELSNAFGEKTGNKINYSRDIMKEFDKFVDEYNAVMQRYSDALDNAEQMLASHSLATTRSTYNDFLLTKYNGLKWNFGGATVPYEEMSDAQKEGVVKLLENNGLLFDVEDTVESWAERQREKLQNGKITDAVKDVIRATFDQFKLVENPGELTGFQKDVQDVKDAFGDIIRKALEESEVKPDDIEAFVAQHQNEFSSKFKADATTVFSDFLADRVKDMNEVIKSLKETPEKYANFDNAGFTSDWLLNLFLQSLSEKFYGDGVVDFSGTTKDAKAKAREEERQRKERQQKHREWVRTQISNLKQDFQDLKELKAAYDKFKSLGYDDTAIGALLQNYFGTGIPEGGFGAAFEALAAKIEKYSPNDAQDIRNFAAGKDWREYAKSIEDAQKALEKYNEAVAKIEASDFTIHGKFFEFDLNKILRDERNTEGQINKKYDDLINDVTEAYNNKAAAFAEAHKDDAVAVAEAHQSAADAIAVETTRLNGLRAAEIKYNRQLAQAKVNDLASNYVKNTVMRGKGFTMSDWGDKSLYQVQKIRAFFLSTLNEIEQKGIEIDDETKKNLAELGLESTDLVALIKEIIAGNYKESTVEYFKKLQSAMKSFSSLGTQIGGMFSNLGDMFENEGVSSLGSVLDYMGRLADIILDCDALFDSMAESASEVADSTSDAANEFADTVGTIAKSSDWITMIVKVVLLAIEGIANLISGVNEAEKEAVRAQRELTAAAYDYLDALNEIEKKSHDTFFGTDQLSTIATGWKQASDAMENYNGVLQKIIDNYKNSVFHQVTVWFWDTAKYTQYRSLYDFLKYKGVNMPDGTYQYLFDRDTGEFNTEAFKAFWPEWRTHTDDNFGYRLDEEVVNEGDELLKAIEAWEKAVEDFRNNISDMFSDIAASIADNMISAFKETGDALSDLESAFTDLGESIVKMMLQSVIARALKPLEDDIIRIWSEYSAAAGSDSGESAKREATMKALQELSGTLDKGKEILDDNFWNELLGLARDKGMLGSDVSDSGSLGNGIKGITEDTANLLASYLNAIRADVSYGRLQWERIAVAVEGYRAQYITLNDYMAQVAADTANIAETNRQILQRMDGFINDFTMASDYGDSLKVQIVN